MREHHADVGTGAEAHSADHLTLLKIMQRLTRTPVGFLVRGHDGRYQVQPAGTGWVAAGHGAMLKTVRKRVVPDVHALCVPLAAAGGAYPVPPRARAFPEINVTSAFDFKSWTPQVTWRS